MCSFVRPNFIFEDWRIFQDIVFAHISIFKIASFRRFLDHFSPSGTSVSQILIVMRKSVAPSWESLLYRAGKQCALEQRVCDRFARL